MHFKKQHDTGLTQIAPDYTFPFPLLNRNQELWVDMLPIQVCLRDLDEKINETVNTIDMINIGSGLAGFSNAQEIVYQTSECCHCVTLRRLWL